MGTCQSVDDEEEPLSKIIRDNSRELFLSRYKFRVHCNSEPLQRISTFNSIIEEYARTFDETISINDLYDYYSCL